MERGNRFFKWALFLPLILLASYFVLLLLAQVPFYPHGQFAQILGQDTVQHAIWLSLISSTFSTLLALLIALPCAYLLSRVQFPGRTLVDTLLDLPMILTPVALGTLLLMAFNTPAGLFLERFGIQVPFTIVGVIIAQFTVVVAIAIRLLKSTFDDIDPRYEQVARTLGCSAAGAFMKVTLPMARNGILAALILTWARAIAEFGATATLAGTAKGKTATLPTSIFLAISSADLERAVVLILIMVAIALALLLLVRLGLTRRADDPA
jgi:molybdate transport system permease protein